MQHDLQKYLLDVLESARLIQEFVSGSNYDQFTVDELVRAAVERKFEIIGEALTRIKKQDPSLMDHITDHKRIIAFRNVIAHGYDMIVDRLVWEVIQDKLPVLITEVEKLIAMLK